MRRLALVAGAALLPLAAREAATDAKHEIEARLAQGKLHWSCGDLAPAERALDALLGEVRARGDRLAEARTLALLGNVADSLGREDLARRRHAEALAIFRSAGDRLLEARVLADIGYGRWKRADYAGAERSCREALRIQEPAADAPGLAATLRYLGRIHFKQGQYPEAIRLYERALAADRSPAGQAEALEDIGLAFLDQHRYAEALAYFERALSAAESADAGLWCRIRIDGGNLHLFQGDLDAAGTTFDAALARGTASGSAALRASAREQLGRLSGLRGQHDAAAAHLAEALALWEQAGNPRAQAWVLAARAQLLARSGRVAEALASYRKALELWEAAGDRRAVAWHLHEAAAAHERQGDDDTALRLYRRAVEMGREIELPYRPLTHAAIGRLLARRGDCAGALAAARHAVDLAAGEGSVALEWRALHALGLVQGRCGDGRAVASLLGSLERIEQLRHGVVDDDLARVGFSEDKQAAYGDAIAALMERERIGEALEVAERARARALLDLLADRQTAPGAPLRAPLPSLPDLEAEARRGRATILELFVAEPGTYAWVLGPDGSLHGTRLTAGRREIEALVDDLRGALGGADGGRRALRALHAALLEPLARWLPASGAGPLIVIPHGKLLLVPFGALVDGEGRYLVEGRAVGHAPSIATLAEIGRRAEAPAGGVLVVGNPSMPPVPGRKHPLPALDGAEQEARAVAAAQDAASVTLLLGAEAREDRFRELAPQSRVLHLATHGVVKDGDPLGSFLALAAGGREGPGGDGLLSMREVSAMELQADMVALSACDTGLGRITGDGVMGLSRAFLAAGARNVVVSLWRVADVTARHQMEELHRQRRLGQPLLEAMRATQLRTMAALRAGEIRAPDGRPLAEQPLLWAPFVVVGACR